jgi:hypothetical protein
MYVSLPRVSIRRGDFVWVDVYDRDLSGRETIGRAYTTFDGNFPLLVNGRYVRMDCRALTQEQARAFAEPYRADIDGALLRLEQSTAFDVTQPDFGAPREISALKETLGKRMNFRYYAGHLGWDDPQVQARLDRFARAEEGWRSRARTALARRATELPAPPVWIRVGSEEARVTPVGDSLAIEIRPPRRCQMRNDGIQDPGDLVVGRVLPTELRVDAATLRCSEASDGRYRLDHVRDQPLVQLWGAGGEVVLLRTR